MWRRLLLLTLGSIMLLAFAPTSGFAETPIPATTPPGSADASAGPNDVVNTPEPSTTGTGTGFGAPDSSALTVIPGEYGAGGVAAATGGTVATGAVTAAPTGELPFTGSDGLLAVFYGGMLALALGSVLSIAGRRATRRAAHAARA